MKVRVACKASNALAAHRNALNELVGIRNVFAHAGLAFEDFDGTNTHVHHPRKAEGIDFAERYARLRVLEEQVWPAFEEILDKLGAKKRP